MKYKLIKRSNPQKREQVKYYPSPINMGTLDLREITANMGRSSFTRGDIENVLINFVEIIPDYLKRGYSVQLGEIGTLRLSLKGDGALTTESFNSYSITTHLVFTASTFLKKSLSSVHFELVHDDTPTEEEEV